MLKFAHSLSIAFGCMAACINGLCGFSKVSDAQIPASSGECRSAKICAQTVKMPNAAKHSNLKLLRAASDHCEAGFAHPPLCAHWSRKCGGAAAMRKDEPFAVRMGLPRQNPIRAPSAMPL